MVYTSPNLHPLGVRQRGGFGERPDWLYLPCVNNLSRTAAQIREKQLCHLSAKLVMVYRRQDYHYKQRAYQLLRLVKTCEGKHLRTSFPKASVRNILPMAATASKTYKPERLRLVCLWIHECSF